MKKNNYSIYDQIKQNTEITAVARYYGMAVDRRGRALCPFHDDHHPSLSFKNNRFTCFACGARGSVIDLVMQIFHISPLESAVRLRKDVNLEVEVRGHKLKAAKAAAKGISGTECAGKPTDGMSSASRAKTPDSGITGNPRETGPTKSTDAVLAEVLRDRLTDMDEHYSRIHRELCENTVKYAPEEDIETVSSLYVEAVFQWPVISSYLDILDHGTLAEKLELYRAYKRKELIRV